MDSAPVCEALDCARPAYRAILLDGPDGEMPFGLCQEHLLAVHVSGGYTIADAAVIITPPV